MDIRIKVRLTAIVTFSVLVFPAGRIWSECDCEKKVLSCARAYQQTANPR